MPENSVAMSHAERCALWKQRLFEAEAGLTRYLTEQHGGRDLADWITVRGELFSGLPGPGEEDPERWQRVFFRAQALMERFLVSRYGHASLQAWAAANAQVHRYVEPDRGQGALGPVLRIARQAELYASRYRVVRTDADRAAVEIGHCAIWDYRERARSRGVTLTLKSPCEYCTHATAANIAAKGYVPRHELTEGPDGHGCRWEAALTPDGATTGRGSAQPVTTGDGACAA
ncbi:hypothetical protein AB0I82_00775 [Streptomyces sp. NPDC050315]|uniref:hypothetical protein n=1 Tax=Streptomyces sp. NPDC050315 TaxID=3155039 RepID=UPI00341381CB